MKNIFDQLDSLKAVQELDNFFASQLELVGRLRDISRTRDERLWSVIYPLIYALSDSSASLRILARKTAVRDCYVLSRVIFETLVNALYILANGDEVAERASRHAQQKSIRDLDRTIQAGKYTLKIKWQGTDEVFRNPDVQKILEEFKSKKGREVMRWTEESVADRIHSIETHLGGNVSSGLIGGLTLYRHSSDIAHGTLFGTLFSLGLTSPTGHPKSPDELVQHFNGQLSMLFFLLGMCFNSLILGVAPKLGKLDLVKKSNSLISEVNK